MDSIAHLQTAFLSQLEKAFPIKDPKNLYEPMDYIVQLGGKRLRPALTLLSCQLFDKPFENAMNAALAIELFHNFSLVHDDIMDNAAIRRGKTTVHKKWDTNTGILSGDALLILAYQHFESYPPEKFQQLAKLFSKTAIQVCEGQQLDMDFENRDHVSIPEYIRMIEYKTAVLLGAAMQMGAIIADASDDCQQNLFAFGKNLGIAFQLQDDYLDAFGNPETFGKKIGGDIIENKKTYLYINALETLPEKDATELRHVYSIEPTETEGKITTVKEFFQASGATKNIKKEIRLYTEKANQCLEQLEIEEPKKNILREIADQLIHRDS